MAAKTATPLNADQIRSLLPHTHPLLFVDRVLDYEPGQSIHATKNQTFNDPLVRAHYPEFSIVPASLVIEGMGQCCLLLFQLTHQRLMDSEAPVLGSVEARFLKPIVPGDVVHFHVSVVKLTTMEGLFRGVAEVEGEACCRATLAMAKRRKDALRRG